MMKKIYTYCFGDNLGPRFESSFIELWIYNGKSDSDRMEVSKAIKNFMPEDKHGVTSFEEWEIMSRPTIKIYIDISEDQLYRTFVTIPHELSHAIGTGLIRRAYQFRMKDIYPGCEILAQLTGIITCKFQTSYMKEVGLVVKSEKNL